MNSHDDLNDPLDELFNTAVDAFAARRQAAPVTPPAHFVPAVERMFVEACRKCGGSGNWRPGYPCFACKGTGRLTFKTAPEAREKARERATEKARQAKIDKAHEIKAWQEAHPTVWAWLRQNEQAIGTPRAFPFAISLYEALFQYGSLTANQLAAAERCIARKAERQAERAAAAPVVAQAGVDRLKAAFDAAVAFTAAKGKSLKLRSPRITIAGLTIKPAKATSANPGALYVYDSTGEYLGKIAGGKFFAIRACTAEQTAELVKLMADPEGATKVKGQETGVCCICNATLTSKWRLRGIGPICAEKFGWGA